MQYAHIFQNETCLSLPSLGTSASVFSLLSDPHSHLNLTEPLFNQEIEARDDGGLLSDPIPTPTHLALWQFGKGEGWGAWIKGPCSVVL